MYKLSYSIASQDYSTSNKQEQLYSSVDEALSAIREIVVYPDKVIIADHSNEDNKQFRWLYLDLKGNDYDKALIKLSSLDKVTVDQPII